MLHRHRVPTIFSIYMLDVICCALGCVVLLWQVAHQTADEQADKLADLRKKGEQHAIALAQANESAQEFASQAKTMRDKFEAAYSNYLAAAGEAADLETLLALLSAREKGTALALTLATKERDAARTLASTRQDEIDKTKTALSLSAEQLKELEEKLRQQLADNKKSKADLTGQFKINVDLLAKLALAQKQISSLKTNIAKSELELDLSSKKLQEQLVLVKLSDDNARKLQKLLDSLRDESKDAGARLKLTAKDLADAKDRMAALLSERDQWKEKSITASKELAIELDLWKQRSIVTAKELGALKDEKSKLSQRIAVLQAEVDQRFAGVPLTGESIIFLIDVSGSMVMKDAKTPDPDKWPFVCETLMQLMKSLTSMKRFQVIVFSDKVEYLFGNKDYWMKYEGPQTANAARDKLKKFEVGGNTNMHDGFDEAFRYRKMGLDTIYFFSDGLPNVGEGLPATIRSPSEAELSFHLGKHVRDKLKTDWNRPILGRELVRINAIGFFFESPDVGAFLWSLAREHRGNFVGVR